MILLQSRLEGMEQQYAEVKEEIDHRGFVLGGNWDYDHGYFDRSLDERETVWLRIPFQVTNGVLDGETIADDDTRIVFGAPFVLKHIYNEGVDEEGESGVLRSLVDQFQEPVDSDAAVEDQWIDAARRELQKLEAAVIG